MTPGWPLLPLRLFLGVTFVFAGLQKLANPAFLTGSGPVSIHAQLAGAARTSPVHGLLHGLLPISTAVGVLIAVGELAVGVGTLVGLWSRVAAAGGMAVSLGLFLSVSYHSSPYFTGSDIVFLFAWTPLLLAGAGGAPGLDTWLLTRSQPVQSGTTGVSRREVVAKGAAAGLVAGLVVVAGGAAALVGRLTGGSKTSSAGTSFGTGPPPPTTSPVPTTVPHPASTSTSSSPPASLPRGKKLGSASAVPATSGHFIAFDAVCPHAGCTVAYQRGAKVIACPCHGSEFNAQTGAVEVGPASQGLGVITVQEGGDGNLYVDG